MQLDTDKTTNYLHWTITAALGVAVVIELAVPGVPAGLISVIIVLAAIASVTALTRQLPLPSVVFAAAIAALIGGAAHGLSARTGVPFGPVTFSETAGPKLFNIVPWTLPLLWIVAIFNSRGVARLVLRPWRKVRNYGLWLMGLAAGLALAFDLALEPFASRKVKGFWIWQPTKISFTWHGASLLNFLGWVFVSLLIMAFVMPYLIRKQPGNPSSPDFAPLVLWLGALGLFAISAGMAGLWSSVIVDAILAVGVAVFSWRGTKW